MKAVLAALDRELAHQALLDGRCHEVGAWLLILRRRLRDAENAWAGPHGDEDALREVLGIAAACVRCLKEQGDGEH